MSEKPGLTIRADGEIVVESAAARASLSELEGAYDLALSAAGLVILKGAGRGSKTRVAMAGELVARTSMLEVLNIVATANWRGELHVLTEDAHRILGIDQAAVKHAKSNHVDDRLGQVLYRNGAISRLELTALSQEVEEDKRFGQLVLEHELLTQEELFAQLRKQTEQIFFAALLADNGHYLFLMREQEAEAPAHTVHLPVQHLLMEGVQRIDEMSLFRERIPSDDICPIPQQKMTTMSLDESSAALAKYANGERTIEEIARVSGLGTFLTVKAVYGLLQQNALTLKRKTTIDEKAIKKIVREFNSVLRDIFMAVATYGGIDQTRSTLSAWIVGSGYSPILGEEVDEDGSIRMMEVVARMKSVPLDNPMEFLFQAMHELAAFALFAATTSIPRAQEAVLSRDVNTRLKRIRL